MARLLGRAAGFPADDLPELVGCPTRPKRRIERATCWAKRGVSNFCARGQVSAKPALGYVNRMLFGLDTSYLCPTCVYLGVCLATKARRGCRNKGAVLSQNLLGSPEGTKRYTSTTEYGSHQRF